MPYPPLASPANIPAPNRNELYAEYMAWFATQEHRAGWPLNQTEPPTVPLPQSTEAQDVEVSR